MARAHAILLLGLALALAAPAARAVLGGAVDPNVPDSPWAGVGAVETGLGHYTGALIGPRHVLTAAHVVANRPVALLYFRLNRGDDAFPLPARAVHVHPGYRGRVEGNRLWHDDLAIIELALPAPAGAPIYPLLDALPRKGALVAFVGYGRAGDGQTGPTQPSSLEVKRVGYNRLDRLVSPAERRHEPSLFLFDYDAPDSPARGLDGPVGDGGEASFAAGDSGAPVFLFHAGAWRLMGVAAFVLGQPERPGRYGSLAGGTLVSPRLDWIRGVLAGPAP